MREMKFRGKSIKTREWIYGYYWTNEKGNHFIKRTVDLDGCFTIEDIEVIPETIEQYTGLHDKNNVEIYEGDIVKGKYLCESDNTLDPKTKEVKFIGKVIFEDSGFMIECISEHIHNSQKRAMFTLEYFHIKIEVIGNIFEEVLQELLNTENRYDEEEL